MFAALVLKANKRIITTNMFHRFVLAHLFLTYITLYIKVPPCHDIVPASLKTSQLVNLLLTSYEMFFF